MQPSLSFLSKKGWSMILRNPLIAGVTVAVCVSSVTVASCIAATGLRGCDGTSEAQQLQAQVPSRVAGEPKDKEKKAQVDARPKLCQRG